MNAGWEHFEHPADIGIRGIGASPEGAFGNAALALVAVVTDPAGVRGSERVVIRCEAPDLEALLIDWLNAVIFEMAVRSMVFGSFRVRIDGTRLQGAALGERVDAARHQPAVEVKGASYAELKVGQNAAGLWIAQCIVDV